MPVTYPLTRPSRLLVALFLTLPAALWAQTDSAPAASSPTAPPAPAADQTVKLDPFEVKSDSNSSYSTLNSNSITRFNVELNKLPISADIFDQAFMSDIAATSVESMLMGYSAGAGYSGNDPGATASASPGDHSSHANLQLRGFTASYIERDALMPVGSFFNPGSTGSSYTSNFDIERAEVINGPQAMLYSGGGGGGVINVTSKQARLGQPAAGSLLYRVDQYGTKYSQVDYGAGSDYVAVRFAAVNANLDTRRINLSSSLEGYYLQVAGKVANTVIRVSGEQTTYNHLLGSSSTLTAASTSADSRNGASLAYLLATNQAGGNTLNAAGAPNGSGAIDNGELNWANVNSYGGYQENDLTVNTFVLATADTTWTSWLSTQLSAGYDDFNYDLSNPGVSFYSPTSSSNPLTGSWAVGMTPGDLEEPGRAKAVRFVALATNDFFNGKAHSQTIVGGDFLRQDAAQLSYSYLQADSNFNYVINPATITTIQGRTLLPKQFYTITNGPVAYPFFGPRSATVNIGGVNYRRGLENTVSPALITPANPMGTVGTTGTYEIAKAFNQGWFGVNNTQWFDGKVDTLIGIRQANFFTQTQTAATPDSSRRSNSLNYDVGIDYALLPWLRAYVSASNAYYPPEEKGSDPIGDPTPTAHAVGQEYGFKLNTADNRFSGSLALYHDAGKNEQYVTSSTIESDINPSGLNGRFGVGPAAFVYVDRTSTGVNLVLTANPTPNWRLRLNASDVGGKVGTSTSFGQLYNDQFNENAAGQVTYADGSLVYVAPTFNSKSPTATSTTAGAVPLTVAAMNNPASVYYANPVIVNGQISSTSAVYSVLKSVDPTHGAIVTGKVGLPISSIQITPPFALPGVINVTQVGDNTVGYPEKSFNLTSIYTFSTGWIRGFSAGGTVIGQWDNNQYYYYPLGVTNSLARADYALPNNIRLDLILGYSHKFRRVSWGTQLNVTNLFNHYDVVLLPNEVTGWSTQNGVSARFAEEPRAYTWTNTITF